ncbi:MAG: zinc-dependent alcohol dehydrogenase family protein [Deltaproteobacteria bacterium]|nr:zinc-dependent alcohol dehydrogenase family protein [Deltaproteobacteria bacterium]
MKAMVLNKLGSLEYNKDPLELTELPEPVPGQKKLLVKVFACGVCHTELDEIEGRTPPPKLPVVLGHQVVGRVEKVGEGVSKFRIGDRVGIGWIYSTCGHCHFCLSGRENLCKQFLATGRDSDGGYAEYMKVPETFAYPIPDYLTDAEAAPLLCAGAIGYRSLRLSNISDGQNLGLTGFGASAHLVLKTTRFKYPAAKIFVFARSEKERQFAMELGAAWAGATEDYAPEKLDAIIDTTPAWRPVVHALKNLKSGGRLAINAIRKEETDKEDLLQIDYPEHLWMEKEIKSVANVTGIDISEFLHLAAQMKVRPDIQEFPLEDANKALMELKKGKIRGAKVLRISDER